MRQAIYKAFVNRVPGIAFRYHRVHDGSVGVRKVWSWIFLFLLNFLYYVLFMKFLGRVPESTVYEVKRLLTKESESENFARKHRDRNVETFVKKMAASDVVSFDIFDTLIFRSLEKPVDVFQLIGDRLGLMDFVTIRRLGEWDARVNCYEAEGHMEVTLPEIWERIYLDLGAGAAGGMEIEQEVEKEICYGNPFMLAVWKRLQDMGKTIIVNTDMYLSEQCLTEILEKNGFTGMKKLYVSGTLKKSKAKGNLYELVKADFPAATQFIHVGDNLHSDVKMAKRAGFASLHYLPMNTNTMLYRAQDMSPLIGSAYRATVNARLYNGLNTYPMEYEYGYIYGGLFVLGYCHYIHDYVEKNAVDKVLFLSRDGEILQKVYQKMYPEEETAYVYWSRKAAVKLLAEDNKHDFFRRFIDHKINQKYTLQEILEAMEIGFLCEGLSACTDIFKKKEKRQSPLQAKEELTDKNGFLLRRYIEKHWEEVMAVYAPQRDAAKQYYSAVLQGVKKAAAVDIGWAGSGALALAYLVERRWKLGCELVGVVAGTNTIHNSEPEASEVFLQNGKLVSYLYSQAENRDLMKKHNPAKDYNVFWELLLSSESAGFNSFVMKNGEVDLVFGKKDANPEGIREIQKGILDFADDYLKRFEVFPDFFKISGRDAYAPMVVACSYHEKYAKAMKEKFKLEINVS